MKRAQELREETLRLKHENKLPVFGSGMKSPPPKPVVVRLPCIHEGPVLEWCNSCSGQLKHVRECDVYDKCTRVTVGPKIQGCDQCPSYARESPKVFDTIDKRHLVYHLLPVSGNGAWQHNVNQLTRRWDQFSGKKVIAVMVGSDTKYLLDPPGLVRRALPSDCEVIEVENSTRLREVVTWEELWRRVLGATGLNDAVLYAHGKGVTRSEPEVRAWTDLLYELNLDHWGKIEQLLRKYPIVGSLRRIRDGFTASESKWHYSGTFFWVRASDFLKRNWNAIDQRWYGAESWPGLHYSLAESGCLFMSEPEIPDLDLYHKKTWDQLNPLLEKWRVQNPSATLSSIIS